MKQILVTGANGQLGRELQRLSPNYPDFRFHFTDVDNLDICRIADIEDFLGKNHIDIIINCAAYNNVDGAEKEAEEAFLINSIAVKYLAQLAEKNNIFFIHISTDYVFDGMNHIPYKESDQPNPLSTYARSKHEGETQVSNTLERAMIIRTSWLYSVYGNNFVKTILKHAKQKKQLKVVCDQVGTPTYSSDLAGTIISLIPHCKEINEIKILHYSNEGVASWYDFAKAIIDISGIECNIIPVPTKEYPLPARRPFFSILDKSMIKTMLNIDIPYWRDSLRECLSKMD
jgi:dTDP-4-dehydrorhamnose reductase